MRAPDLRNTAIIAFLVSLLLLFGKFTAFFLTGSTAVLSDAMESIINVATGAFVVISVTISSLPADENHPYGHGKVEAFSAGLEGGLILVAAIVILLEAVPEFLNPSLPQRLNTGIVLLFGAGMVNLLLGLFLIRNGRKQQSEALQANGRHLLTDFYTSAGVILGLLTVSWTGWAWLDPLIACLVAINILVPGIMLVRNAIRNLMNETDPEALWRVLEALKQMKFPVWLCPHELRVIRSGRYHHIDLHLTLPHYWPLSQAHEVQKEIADNLLRNLGTEGDVMIHLDPCEPSSCESCNLQSCGFRQHAFTGKESWSLEKITAPKTATADHS